MDHITLELGDTGNIQLNDSNLYEFAFGFSKEDYTVTSKIKWLAMVERINRQNFIALSHVTPEGKSKRVNISLENTVAEYIHRSVATRVTCTLNALDETWRVLSRKNPKVQLKAHGVKMVEAWGSDEDFAIIELLVDQFRQLNLNPGEAWRQKRTFTKSSFASGRTPLTLEDRVSETFTV